MALQGKKMFYFREEWENLMANFRKNVFFKKHYKNILGSEAICALETYGRLQNTPIGKQREFYFSDPRAPSLYAKKHYENQMK